LKRLPNPLKESRHWLPRSKAPGRLRLLCCFSILAYAVSGFAGSPQLKPPIAVAPVVEGFAAGVETYVKIVQDLEMSVPSQKPTNEPEQIADRQHQLTGLIANARLGAHQGEIFTEEVTKQFHTIIRKAFREPGGRAMRKTIQERNPVKHILLKVNDVYPDDQTRTTMPPTLLRRLPILPSELAYRIIGHALVLQDTRTNLIVDFLPNAIP
jgi:hypothetical protein